MAVQLPPNSTGQVVDTVQATVGKERQIAAIGDPISGVAVATVAQFHNADTQTFGATTFGFLTDAVNLILNPTTNAYDRMRVAPQSTGFVGVIKVTDPLGANIDHYNSRLLEQILLELRTLSINHANWLGKGEQVVNSADLISSLDQITLQ